MLSNTAGRHEYYMVMPIHGHTHDVGVRPRLVAERLAGSKGERPRLVRRTTARQ